MAHHTEEELILHDSDPEHRKILLLWLKIGLPVQVAWSRTPNSWRQLPSNRYEPFIQYFEDNHGEDTRLWKLYNENES